MSRVDTLSLSKGAQVLELSESEKKFAQRQVRYTKLYLVLSIVGIAAAVAIAAIALSQEKFDAKIFALCIVLLLGARGNLKQHKDARIIKKLKEGSA